MKSFKLHICSVNFHHNVHISQKLSKLVQTSWRSIDLPLNEIRKVTVILTFFHLKWSKLMDLLKPTRWSSKLKLRSMKIIRDELFWLKKKNWNCSGLEFVCIPPRLNYLVSKVFIFLRNIFVTYYLFVDFEPVEIMFVCLL